MNVSVVIPAYNRAALTEQCLRDVRKTAPDAEVVLVDNGSTDETGLLYDYADLVVDNVVNLGFAEGCNRGAAKATGDVLIFLNNDTRPERDWADRLAAVFDDPEAGVAGPLLLYPDRTVQHAGVRLYVVDGTLTAYNIGRGEPLALKHLRVADVDAVTGACMAVRRDCWDALDGFDVGYWNGYEDVDLCLRARDLNWRVRYEPRSVVVHLESQSGPERWSAVHENVRRLNDRWCERWQQTRSTS